MWRSQPFLDLFVNGVVCLLVATSCQTGWAQAATASGSVRGVVSDNSGAVIAGASGHANLRCPATEPDAYVELGGHLRVPVATRGSLRNRSCGSRLS